VCPGLGRSCPRVLGPVWSPDGRELAFAVPGHRLGIVYADGSCLDCSIAAALGGCLGCTAGEEGVGARNAFGTPVFDERGGTLLYWDDPGRGAGKPGLWEVGDDGLSSAGVNIFDPNPPPLALGGFQPAVSVTGAIAFVRSAGGEDWIFVLHPDSRYPVRLVPGSAPDWSPDGRSIAFDDGGSVAVVGAAGGPVHVLAPGRLPVWSPNSHWIAFLGGHDRVSIIDSAGGSSHRVGHLRAAHLSWQPIVRGRPRCVLPAATTGITDTTTSLVRGDVTVTYRDDANSDFIYMGCWRARGVLRLIDSGIDDGYSTDEDFGFQASGPYVAFETLMNGDHYGDTPNVYGVVGFDLASGRRLFDDGDAGYVDGSSPVDPALTHTHFKVDSLVIGPTGAVAWISDATTFATTETTTTTTSTGTGGTSTTSTTTTTVYDPVTTYQVTVNDGDGTRVLDSAVQAAPGAPLAGLSVSGSMFSWLDDGEPRSSQLG